MNRYAAAIFLVFIAVVSAVAQEKFTMDEVIERTLNQSLAYKRAETNKEFSYWQYRFYRSNYIPQVRASSNTGALYSNSIFPVRQPDGSIIYRPLNQLNPGINFGLFQPISLTGGSISMNSSYNYFRDYAGNFRQWNGAPLSIQLSQPLFGYNSLKWDKMIQPIRFEESKRVFSESVELISHDAVDNFFSVITEQINLQIAKFNLANNDTIYKIEKGRYDIGKTSEDKLLQVELQLLRSRKDVAQANLNLRTASQKLRSFMGLRTGDNLTMVLPEVIPTFSVTEEEALDHARETRSAYIAFARRRIEAQAGVAQTRGQLYSVAVNASYGLNNVTQTFNDLYRNTTKQQVAGLTFDIPLVDWGRRRAQMQTAYATKRLADYTIQQDEITFEQDILTQVRQFEMLQLQIEITRKSDEVAMKRYNVAQNRYLIGKIDITNLNIALTEKDDAKRAYIIALKNFWLAYYDLRRLTLYDFAQRKYLYNPFSPD